MDKVKEVPTAQEFLKAVPAFVSGVVFEAKNMGLDISTLEKDHFCLRVESAEQYHHYKNEFVKLGTLLSEAQINGRPIATYKLHQPIEVENQRISCIEIPFPKDGSPYPLGLEHVECVVEEALTVFIQRYPQLKFNTRAMKQPLNPEVALVLPSGKSVKFHNQSLEKVIEIENKLL